MAIFLLDNVGASVTGTAETLNGGIWNINIEATNYGGGAGVILESRLITNNEAGTPLVFVPLTRLGVPASISTNQSVILRIASNGFQLRARTDTGCVGVTVTALSAGSKY